MNDRARTYLVWCATICHVIAILFLLVWISRSDILFGHYHAPLKYLVSAGVAAAFGAILTITWLVNSSEKRGKAAPIQIILLIVAALIIWGSYAEYSFETELMLRRGY